METYRTRDLNTAAMLLTNGGTIESIDRDEKYGDMWFSFQNTETLKEALQGFVNETLTVNFSDYLKSFKRLKAIVRGNSSMPDSPADNPNGGDRRSA